MFELNNDFVTIEKAEEAIRFATSEGEALLTYGTDDLSNVASWLNLAQLALEMVPACLESLHDLCFDSRKSNRDRVAIALSILRDAQRKVHNPLYFALYEPSREYLMLVERILYYGGEGLSQEYSPYL